MPRGAPRFPPHSGAFGLQIRREARASAQEKREQGLGEGCGAVGFALKPRSISEQCEVLAVPSQMGRRMGSAFRGKHETPGLCQKPHTLMPRVFRTWPWAQNQVARMLNFLRVGRAVRQKALSSFVNPCRSPAPSWYPGPLELTASAPKRHGRFGVETPSCPLHLSAGFEP